MLIKTDKDIFYLLNKYSCFVSRVEAEMLLEYLFNCSRLDLYTKNFSANRVAEELYASLVNRRIKSEPVQYITGKAEFMGLDFIVTKDTFIPRPETELLVNEIIKQRQKVKILDLCTGSGNIAISLARSMPDADITAADVSEAALKIARKNAERHNVTSRINFLKGDMFNALMFAKKEKFDIIVCNPPYIKEEEIDRLQEEVGFEPGIALNGGSDGLDFYRIMAEESHRYLKKGGSVLLEMGFHQAQAVKDIFLSYNIFEIYKVIKDFSGTERVIWINLL
ncbi:MAG: peptide chain release factor N(5)-glutamine methyltransferase [Candidatus Omnitrophota bacterium]|nr:peptide chain release factor N(5)-glutamine methyltransferase [Candidatus Omnitrophota bacterium]